MEKATYSLSALKQCKELIRKNRWSTRLKAEHNSRCAEVNILFASCQKLLNYEITDKCRGCTACARVCPVNAITGKVKEMHHIDRAKCIKCGSCMEKCRFGAIVKN